MGGWWIGDCPRLIDWRFSDTLTKDSLIIIKQKWWFSSVTSRDDVCHSSWKYVVSIRVIPGLHTEIQPPAFHQASPKYLEDFAWDSFSEKLCRKVATPKVWLFTYSLMEGNPSLPPGIYQHLCEYRDKLPTIQTVVCLGISAINSIKLQNVTPLPKLGGGSLDDVAPCCGYLGLQWPVGRSTARRRMVPMVKSCIRFWWNDEICIVYP